MRTKYKLRTLVRNTLPHLKDTEKFSGMFQKKELRELLARVYAEQMVEFDTLKLDQAITDVLHDKCISKRIDGKWFWHMDEFAGMDDLDESTETLKTHQQLQNQGYAKHFKLNDSYAQLMQRGLSLAEAKAIIRMRNKKRD